MLLKVLADKQESTENFIEQEKEASLSQVEARLEELQERAKQLRERQSQIATLRNLPDIQLIQVSIDIFSQIDWIFTGIQNDLSPKAIC